MEAEMRRESSWLGSWWRASRKDPVIEPVKSTAVVGALTHDIMSLMSKLIMLWNSLSDGEIMRLREVVLKSAGIRKLVSNEDDVLLELVLNEMIENWVYVAKYVSRFGKKCLDPVACRFEEFLNDPDAYDLVCYEWEYNSNKMERKVRKMERLVGASMQLNQELDVLTEMEQTFRRMHLNSTKKTRLLEFQQKIMWQCQMVKDIREKSLWNKTYDYTVRLMARSLFTILNRLKDTLGAIEEESLEKKIAGSFNAGLSHLRSQSFSGVVHSSRYPNENNIYLQDQEPVERSILISVTQCNKTKTKMGKAHHRSSSSFSGKKVVSRSKNQVHAGPFRGCMLSDYASPSPLTCKLALGLGLSMRMDSFRSKRIDISNKHSPTCKNRFHSKIRLHSSKQTLSMHPQNTLGHSGLALHYANVIILIEKLATAPHLIGKDARDDLYKMLPTAIKSTLSLKLKPCAKALASHIYDAQLAGKWKSAVTQILEWLAPLAHDTIRWQAERNFEKQHSSSSMTNALLVQTLQYANQKKTEAAVIELLLGLNYLCRFGTRVKSTKRLIPNEYMLQAEIVVL